MTIQREKIRPAVRCWCGNMTHQPDGICVIHEIDRKNAELMEEVDRCLLSQESELSDSM